MATAKIYGLGMTKVISGSVNFTGDTIKCALFGAGYTPNQDTDEFYSGIIANEIDDAGTNYTAGGQALANKSVITYNTATNTVAWTADNPLWNALTCTAGARYAVFYKWTGSAATSPLLAYIDFGTTQTADGDNVSIVIPATGIAQFTVL